MCLAPDNERIRQKYYDMIEAYSNPWTNLCCGESQICKILSSQLSINIKDQLNDYTWHMDYRHCIFIPPI